LLVDCRYAGQSHELTVRSPGAFHAEHERRNGFSRPGAPVQVIAMRARARRPSPLTADRLPAVERRRIRGPDVVAERDCTVCVPDGWVAEPGPLGAWIVVNGAA
jgi:N-methylhydantoinase A/oxoprolinase/acetone carboxylase beta subunit